MVNTLGAKPSSTSAPNPTLPEKKKREDYHKAWIQWILNTNIDAGWSTRLSILDSCYRFYDNVQGGDQFRFMQEAEDQSALPAVWQTLPSIRKKIHLLLGDFSQRGYDFKVEAINPEARSRKLQAKEKVLVDMRLQEFAEEFEAQTGMPFTQDNMPEDEEELDEYFEKNYKERSELIMYYALKYLDKKGLWGKVRQELFQDELVAGMCFCKTDIVNGLPIVRRVDPRYFVYDRTSENDLLTDSTYFGEVRWMSIGAAAQKYNMTEEELQSSYKQYTDFLKLRSKQGGERNQFDYIGFDSLRVDSGLQWFQQTDSGLKILIFEAHWQDYKMMKYKSDEDKYGYEQFNRISDSAQDREGVTSKRVKVWRKGTLIAGQFLKDWGLMENQPRDNEDLAEAHPPYFGLIPFYVSGRAVSMVDQLKGLQNFKDIIFYNIQLAISRAGSKGFVYDVSQCPPDWDIAQVMKYLKTTGIAFIDSKSGGTPSQYNQFQTLDLSLAESVGEYINLSIMIDREMDSISGVNEARQGVIQGASQGASVTQSALLQSSLITEPYFKFFNHFSTNVWNNMAKLVKIAWAGKERFAPIIGDAGVDFLKEDIDLSLDDYGVFIEETPRLVDDLNSFQALVMTGLQQGQLRMDDAIKLLLEKDVVNAVRKLEKIMNKREQEQREQEMAMQEQQAQLQLQQQQAMGQWNAQQSEQAAQKAVALQAQKGQDQMKQIAAQGHIDLSEQQVKSLTELLKAKEQAKKPKTPSKS